MTGAVGMGNAFSAWPTSGRRTPSAGAALETLIAQ